MPVQSKQPELINDRNELRKILSAAKQRYECYKFLLFSRNSSIVRYHFQLQIS